MYSLFIEEASIELLRFFSGGIFGVLIRTHTLNTAHDTCGWFFGSEWWPPAYAFFVGSLLRLVFAKSLSCFSDINSAIFFDAPFRLDLSRSPRCAASAAPAAICCFFDFAGILLNRPFGEWLMYSSERSPGYDNFP
jgi:hypothetical protein